jgi:hypothetical protein
MGHSFVPCFVLAISSTLLACGGSAVSGPAPGPSIVAETSKCTAGLTTLATIAASQNQIVRTFSVGADGTVYFVETGPPGATGVFKVAAPGAVPVMLTDFAGVGGIWVDGDTLWLASGVGLYSMPATGGQPTPIGSIPDAQTNLLYAKAFVLDATALYMTGHRQNGAELEVWRIGRADGSTQLLFLSDDMAMGSTWIGPLVADADALYFVGTSSMDAGTSPLTPTLGNASSSLLRLPKTGGTPVIARDDMGSLDQTLKLALFGKDFYADVMPRTSPTDSALGRFPLDPTLAPERINLVDGAPLDALVADDAGVYGALGFGTPASTTLALARIPTGMESSSALGCTPARDAGEGLVAEQMALDGSHVYALLHDLNGHTFTIVRAAR